MSLRWITSSHAVISADEYAALLRDRKRLEALMARSVDLRTRQEVDDFMGLTLDWIVLTLDTTVKARQPDPRSDLKGWLSDRAAFYRSRMGRP